MPFLTPKCVFINYRRGDSSTFARWLSQAIEQNFGEEHVFIDTGVIESGEEWPAQIGIALKRAAVLVAVIGREWLSAQDKHYKRRIDDPNDWVRKELEYGIKHKIPIIPLLVMDALLPDREALPPSLKSLNDYQTFAFRENEWKTDLGQLLTRLEHFGFRRTRPQVRYPVPSKQAEKLTDEELAKVTKRLSNWKLVTDRLTPEGDRKTELRRIYEFGSFEDAIHFMTTATRHISRVDHHPDWENIWRTITVWLTTWDLGHYPSLYDVELAEYLDQLYLDYESKKSPKPISKTSKRSSHR
ncbi:MAG TPA: 4a-hydroxytetrahydrobiopterin dehydratase [Pyrinomonadaceae bacterium]|nr:4a-hydroxytetrahydrobiopterin dehydratase [Pyrinomonadaceae bacterium]